MMIFLQDFLLKSYINATYMFSSLAKLLCVCKTYWFTKSSVTIYVLITAAVTGWVNLYRIFVFVDGA